MVELEPQDRKRYADALIELLMGIEPHIAADISLELERLKPEQWGVLTWAATRVVLQHIFQGFPLAFPPVVVQAYLDAGENFESPLFECGSCGYGLLRTFTACPLCGGAVGLGLFARGRGRQAELN